MLEIYIQISCLPSKKSTEAAPFGIFIHNGFKLQFDNKFRVLEEL
jgi:invasion protein IalB